MGLGHAGDCCGRCERLHPNKQGVAFSIVAWLPVTKATRRTGFPNAGIYTSLIACATLAMTWMNAWCVWSAIMARSSKTRSVPGAGKRCMCPLLSFAFPLMFVSQLFTDRRPPVQHYERCGPWRNCSGAHHADSCLSIELCSTARFSPCLWHCVSE